MNSIPKIGKNLWLKDEIIAALPEFIDLYSQRPIRSNDGGMKAPHMLATWFMLRQLNPESVIESGVWKGQGTWLIEKALPNAKLYCIDPNLDRREYISTSAKYFKDDFKDIDWSQITNKVNTILFFDDHQNAFNRIISGEILGFKQFIFEDNYPAQQGDCYSLRKVFQHAGFKPQVSEPIGIKDKIKTIFRRPTDQTIAPNKEDEKLLKEKLEIYCEFPPIFKPSKTRWKDDWNHDNYPTLPPVLDLNQGNQYQLLLEEAIYYTWICYAKIR